jgi:hypothetical protein
MAFDLMSEKDTNLFKEVINQYFPYLNNLKIFYMIKDKKSKSNGEFVIGKVIVLNEFQNFLSSNNDNIDGFDLAIVIDDNVFINVKDENDRKNFAKILLNSISYNEKLKVNKYNILNSKDLSEEEVNTYERIQLIADQVYTKE